MPTQSPAKVSRRARIGLMIDPWDYPFNGTVVSTRRFVSALEHQFDFTIFKAGEDNGADPRSTVNFKKISVPGVNHIIDKMQAPIARPDLKRLERNLSECDLLHIQYPFLLAHQAIPIARKIGIPVISSFHVQPENILRNLKLPGRWLTPWLYRRFVQAIYQPSDLVIAPSAFARQLLIEQGLNRPIEVLSNGVTQTFFDTQRAQNSGPRFSILSVGRMAREKQQDLLIRAIGQSKFKSTIDLTLAGTGPLTENLRQLAKKEGVSADIGRVSDPALQALYQKTDLFVQCSQIELEGMSALEAMAAGCPTLINHSQTSALAELAQDPAAEFFDSNPKAVSAHIDRLLSSPSLRSKIGIKNRAFAQTRRHDKSVNQLKQIYTRTLEEAPGPGDRARRQFMVKLKDA